MKKYDIIAAPLGEAALILLVGGIGMFLHRPMIFTSLGPTAYEMLEKPRARSARPYNIIVGHLVGVLSGFAAVAMLHARLLPSVTAVGTVYASRLLAAGIAAALTAAFTLLLGASQPAALSTTLLVALGTFKTFRDATSIVLAVVIITMAGEPIRKARLKRLEDSEQL